MIGFPRTKINIGLKIISRLPSGYHEIKSLMVPTNFYDVLEFVPARKDRLEITGLKIPGDTSENILWKVLKILREEYDIPPLKIHLQKNVPAGAGLGGGSSDAAYFMNMLNDYFNLDLSIEEREEQVSVIGSDCPFFIRNEPAIITGTGTELHPYSIELWDYYLVIAFPGYSISTALAYAKVIPGPENKPLEDLLSKNISSWKDSIQNDFEKSLFPGYPGLARIKDEFYNCGAIYAALSGSGSALYGIFRKKPALSAALKKVLVYEGGFKT